MIEVLDTYLKQNQFFNIGLYIYPTAALVSQKDLNIAFDKFLNGNFDSLIPIIKYPHPIQRAPKFLMKENCLTFLKILRKVELKI